MKTSFFSIFLFFIFISTAAVSQFSETEAQNLIVNWQEGDTKTITQLDSSVVTKGDTVIMSTASHTDYTIKIASKRDTIYEVLFKQINIDTDIDLQSELMDVEDVKVKIQTLMSKMQAEMKGFEYSFLVNQVDGKAFAVKNQKKLETKIEELVVVFLNQYLDSSAIAQSGGNKYEIELFIKNYMQEQMPAAINTIINSFNYIFQAYAFPFVLNKTHETESSTYSVNEIEHGNEESPAKFFTTSSLDGNSLSVNQLFKYDKRTMYQKMIVDKGKKDEIPYSQFEMYENIHTKFNIDNSWITHSVSTVKVKMNDIRVKQTSTRTIK